MNSVAAAPATVIRGLVPSSEPGRLVTFAELPAPEAGPREAVIAVEAFSINRGELLMLSQPPEGWRPGIDLAGTVLRAAADGSGPVEGTRVVGQAQLGSWATQVAVSTDALAELPGSVSFEQAATCGAAALTSLRLLRAAGSVAGKRLLLTGASGGLGHFFVELASAQGGRVTAVTRSHERGARLLELGAEALITDVAAAEAPFDVVLDSVGGPTLTTAITKVAPGGLVLWLGQAGGEPAILDMYAIGDIAGARITPFSFFKTGASDAADLTTLVGLVARDRLHPVISAVADWTQTENLLNTLAERRLIGNAVLTVTP
jgi:NADPH2:quinone reductase